MGAGRGIRKSAFADLGDQVDLCKTPSWPEIIKNPILARNNHTFIGWAAIDVGNG
jgi:hypothetical protein